MRLELYDTQDLNFVELNITGGNDTLIRCDKESKFVDTTVFNLFAQCFEAANKLYDYYGPTKYNSRKIIPLRNEIMKFKDKMTALESYVDFEGLVSAHFLGAEFFEELKAKDPECESNWEAHRDKLVVVAGDIISLTEKCADEERILWVVGY